MVLFLRGAGVAEDDLAEVAGIVRANRETINKFQIVRIVLTSLKGK